MKYIYGYLSDFSIEEYEKTYAVLNEEERKRVDRYKRDDDKKRSLLAHILLKKLMKDEFSDQCELLYKENGCPYFKDKNLFVSLSHSGEVAFCGVSKNPVGVDVEQMREVGLSLIKRVCVDEEKAYVLSDVSINEAEKISDPTALKRFFEIWTAKEAYFKMKGSGITDLKSVNTLEIEKESFAMDSYVFTITEEKTS